MLVRQLRPTKRTVRAKYNSSNHKRKCKSFSHVTLPLDDGRRQGNHEDMKLNGPGRQKLEPHISFLSQPRHEEKSFDSFRILSRGDLRFLRLWNLTSMPQWHCIYRYLEMIPIAPRRDKLCLHCHNRDIHECLLINVLERRPLRRKEDRTTTKQWLRTFTDKLSISFRLKACFNGLCSIRITFILIWKSGFVVSFL